MLSAKAKHPNCAYKWLVHLDAEGAGPAGDLLRRDAGQLEGVRDHGQALEGLVRAVPRERAWSYFKSIKFWKTPVADCGNGKKDCMDYTKWVTAWTGDRVAAAWRRWAGAASCGGPAGSPRRSGAGRGCAGGPAPVPARWRGSSSLPRRARRACSSRPSGRSTSSPRRSSTTGRSTTSVSSSRATRTAASSTERSGSRRR